MRKKNKTEDGEKEQAEEKELMEKRGEAIESFRRLKYRLERKYRETSSDQLIFPEHEQLGKGVNFER